MAICRFPELTKWDLSIDFDTFVPGGLHKRMLNFHDTEEVKHRLVIYKPSVYRLETQAIYIFGVKISNLQRSS